MILNDLSKEPSYTQGWARELDKKLDSDEVGCKILAYGNEIMIQRRDKVVLMSWPFAAMSERIMDDRMIGIDSEEFYVANVANEIRRIVRDYPAPRAGASEFMAGLQAQVSRQAIDV